MCGVCVVVRGVCVCVWYVCGSERSVCVCVVVRSVLCEECVCVCVCVAETEV